MRNQCTAWNKGRQLGQKPPLKPKEIWSLRIRLQLADKARDSALFNLAIDSKLRGCDLVALRVRDVYQGNVVSSRAIVMQRKTHRPVQFEITDATREPIAADRDAELPLPRLPGFQWCSIRIGVVVMSADLAVSGTPNTYSVRASSGMITTRRFCGASGTPLFTRSEANSQFTSIRFPSLDDASGFAPMLDNWTSSAQPGRA